MKHEIDLLQKALDSIYSERNTICNRFSEYGSLEQVRYGLYESIFSQIIGNIESAKEQLKIIDTHLY